MTTMTAKELYMNRFTDFINAPSMVDSAIVLFCIGFVVGRIYGWI